MYYSTMGEHQWNQQIQKSDVLLRSARPVIEDAYNLLKGPGYQVVLTDPDGYMLEVMADTRKGQNGAGEWAPVLLAQSKLLDFAYDGWLAYR